MNRVLLLCIWLSTAGLVSAGTITVDFTPNEQGLIAIPSFLTLQGATTNGAFHSRLENGAGLPQLVFTFDDVGSPFYFQMTTRGDVGVLTPGCTVSETTVPEIVCGGKGDFQLLFWFENPEAWNPQAEFDDLRITGDAVSDEDLVWVPVQRGALYGDTNHDNVIDLLDLNNVRNFFGDSGGAFYSPGDTYPYDNSADLSDLNQVRNHFGDDIRVTPVPEPASFALLAHLAALTVFRGRRRN